MTHEKLTDAIDDIASKLADGNDVETAWFLRGVADGLTDHFDAPREYRTHYVRGHRAGKAQAEA